MPFQMHTQAALLDLEEPGRIQSQIKNSCNLVWSLCAQFPKPECCLTDDLRIKHSRTVPVGCSIERSVLLILAKEPNSGQPPRALFLSCIDLSRMLVAGIRIHMFELCPFLALVFLLFFSLSFPSSLSCLSFFRCRWQLDPQLAKGLQGQHKAAQGI